MEETNIKYGFIPVSSFITTVSPYEIAKDEQTALAQMEIRRVEENYIDRAIPLLFFLLTGGTEQHTYKLILERKKHFENEPIILLTHPGNNSLPAALEILARLKQEGINARIIYLDENSDKDCWKEVEKTVKYFEIYHKLKKTKIGLIGEPSDWLIASTINTATIKNYWGPQIVNLSLDELKNLIPQIKDEEIEDEHYAFVNKAANIKEPQKRI